MLDEAEELPAGRVEGALLGLGNGRIDERAAIFFQLVSQHMFDRAAS